MQYGIVGRSILLILALGLFGCSGEDQTPPATDAAADEPVAAATPSRFGGARLPMPKDTLIAHPAVNANRNAYFGDLHVHTAYSFDAFAFGTLATPYDAYRYARGEAIKHPAGFDVQLREPLDFYAVTDHAMFLGTVSAAADTSTEFSKHSYVERLHNLNAPENLNIDSLPGRGVAFGTFLRDTLAAITGGEVKVQEVYDISRTAWADTIRAAEQFNQPGKFTTFVAYEYTTSSDDRGNLHRNVIFRGADKLPAMPYSRFHSQDPEGLWRWMDDLRGQGIESLAIPHNSNGSNGQMFKLVDWAGDPLDDEYAGLRSRNEPLIEITQIKGTSETHPSLSETDEWADFEIMPYRIATMLYSEPKGSYAREALLNGMAFTDRGITNPFKFGFIGSSDTHTGAISDDESNWFGKVGLLDATASLRGSVPLGEAAAAAAKEAQAAADATEVIARQTEDLDGRTYSVVAAQTWSASGLTGVWAEENERGAIYDAFRRKETFATSGPRIPVRFFAGYGFDEALLGARDMLSQAYANGVSMGSDLIGQKDLTPSFIVWAARDSKSAPLQRLQVVKGWLDAGVSHEQVYDVACSDGGIVDPLTHRCPDNGATVDLATCAISANSGAAELKTLWQDPQFEPTQQAFYYVRVLENPTCRWSTWDALRAGVPPRPNLHPTLQERSWSSPIWYVPLS